MQITLAELQHSSQMYFYAFLIAYIVSKLLFREAPSESIEYKDTLTEESDFEDYVDSLLNTQNIRVKDDIEDEDDFMLN